MLGVRSPADAQLDPRCLTPERKAFLARRIQKYGEFQLQKLTIGAEIKNQKSE